MYIFSAENKKKSSLHMISIFQEGRKKKYPIYFLNHLFIHFEFISFFFIHPHNFYTEFTLQKKNENSNNFLYIFFTYMIKKGWFELRKSFIYILS